MVNLLRLISVVASMDTVNLKIEENSSKNLARMRRAFNENYFLDEEQRNFSLDLLGEDSVEQDSVDFKERLDAINACLYAQGYDNDLTVGDAIDKLIEENKDFSPSAENSREFFVAHDFCHVALNGVNGKSIWEYAVVYLQGQLFKIDEHDAKRFLAHDEYLCFEDVDPLGRILSRMSQTVLGGPLFDIDADDLRSVPLRALGVICLGFNEKYERTEYRLASFQERHEFLNYYQMACEDHGFKCRILPGTLNETPYAFRFE